MATYIMLVSFTEQEICNIKESPARVEAASQTFQTMGAKVKEFYAVMGQYDTVIVLEASDDATVAKAAFTIDSLGSVRTETLRSFTRGRI